MTTREPAINVYNYIDYKAPIVKTQNDFRTLNYLGHRNFFPPTQIKKTEYHDACPIFRQENSYHPSNEFKSETRSQFQLKTINTSNFSTLPIRAKNVHYIQNFEDTKLNHAPREINTTDSVYKQSYDGFQRGFEINFLPSLPITIANSVRKTEDLLINPEKPGYSKYLDLMATTNSLTHVKHPDEHINGIGSKDNITFWNWPKYQNISSSGVACDMCPKITKFLNHAKFVPNNSLTTEVQANFKEFGPKFEIEIKNLYPTEILKRPFQIQNPDQYLLIQKTEYSMYGSGDRLQKYLNC